jgi:hypothetical protein
MTIGVMIVVPLMLLLENWPEPDQPVMKKLALTLAMGLGLIACGGGSKSKPDFILNPPKSDSKIFGSGEATKNSFQLAKEAADTRACRDVARTLNQRVRSVLKDFMSESGANVETAESLELVESTSKSVTDLSVSGCRIDKREQDGKTVYSLAVYDINQAKELIKSQIHKNLASKEALYNRMRADDSFKKLDAELEKLK